MKNDSPKGYLTIKQSQKAKLKQKGSIFMAQAFPVTSEDHAKTRIEDVKKDLFDATHNCFAFRIGQGQEEIVKHSDAGEPRGTAGKPILTAIQSKNLTDILVVVTRYFGGVKLGKGGLSRAYHDSAIKVLDECQVIKRIKNIEMSFSVPLGVYGNVSKIFSKYNCTILKSEFQSTQVKIDLEIEEAKSTNLKKDLTEAADGKIEFL